jgi:hypothetical protein
MKKLLAAFSLVLSISQPAISQELFCARVPDNSQASVFDVNTGELAGYLPKFTEFHYTSVRSDGYVVIHESQVLMVPANQLVASEYMNSCKNHYTVQTVDVNGYVNVRNAPDGDILTTLANGTEVISIGSSGSWARILTPVEGFWGYVHYDFLSSPHFGMQNH